MDGNCGSNAEMSGDIAGNMAFAISNWATYDNWLWKDRCQAGNCNNQDLHFYNIKIKTGGASPTPTPTPTPPSPGNYIYGNTCATSYDDECNGCDCHWSWPADDPAQWSSPDAHCRCKPASFTQ